MNDKFSNHIEDEAIARKLNEVAEKTNVNGQFAAQLEDQLRTAHRSKPAWSFSFAQISPILRWAVLMVLLALVLSWSIRTLIPAPQPAVNNTPVTPEITTSTPAPDVLPDENATPVVDATGYDWRQTKLYLSVPLPQTPAEARLYKLNEEQPATMDVANALALQYGIQGEVYESSELPQDNAAFLVTDGKQRLYVQSALTYDYYADYGEYTYQSGSKTITLEQAVPVIDAFMKAHGMDIPYQVEQANVSPGMFYALPLTPDLLTVRYDYNLPNRLEFTIDENEQVIRVISYQVSFDALDGTYRIRSATEAFQQILNQSETIQNGVLEIMRSAGTSNTSFWSRTYPDNQLITIYGQVAWYPSTVANTSSFVSIGPYTAFGNLSGIENEDRTTFVEATGHFINDNGIRKFNVESWNVTSAEEMYVSGSLRREGDQTILTADDGRSSYVIENVPTDVPLNTVIGEEYLAVHGFMNEAKLFWDSIEYYPSGAGGGGGGGGGNGFYQLNLSGTPVLFATATTVPVISQGTIEYVVKEGNTCGTIALQHGISIAQLREFNGLDENCLIFVGQVLTVPATSGNQTTPDYVVQENDTLASIASNFGISVEQLKQANNLDSDVVYLGQTLFIPSQQTDHPWMGKQLVQQRGTLLINVYNSPDGTSREQIEFYSPDEYGTMLYATLENVSVTALLPYQNRPIEIWGTVNRVDAVGAPVIHVDRYEAPYPGLQFQILRGTQQAADVAGERVALFTSSDGMTYVQLTSIGMPDITMAGAEGDEVLLETLAVPDETFGGYPTVRVFSTSRAVNPKDGKPVELTITANQLNQFDAFDSGAPDENFVPPTLTIEKVELVYYVPDPHYGNQNSTNDPQYIQPAWRFYGHYSDGSEVEFLVQALKEEYLLPELAPYRAPG